MFAYSGVLFPAPRQPGSPALVDYALSLADGPGTAGSRGTAGSPRKRVCYLPTAVGDAADAIAAKAAVFARLPAAELSVLRLFVQPSVPDMRAHLLAQDVILVEGGSVVNLMAIWRAHGLPEILRECWEAGVVLAGTSAGSMCWHLGGPTDSFGDDLAPFTDGLGFLPFSNGVHDDLAEQPRRAEYRRMVAEGVLPAGYATQDGVGLHYLGTELHEAVTILPGRQAWQVRPDGHGGYAEREITPRLI